MADHVALDAHRPPRRHGASRAATATVVVIVVIQQVATALSGCRTVDTVLLQVGHGRHGRDVVVGVRAASVAVDVAVHSGTGKFAAQGPLDVVVLTAVVIVLGFGVEKTLLGLALAVLQLAHLVVQVGHVGLGLGHQGAILEHLGVERLQDGIGDARGRQALDVGAGRVQRRRLGGERAGIAVAVGAVVGGLGTHACGRRAGDAVGGLVGGFSLGLGPGGAGVAVSFATAFLLLGAAVAGGVEVDLVGRQDDAVDGAVGGWQVRVGVRGRAVARQAPLGGGVLVARRGPFCVDQSLLWWLLGLDGHLHCRAGHVLGARRMGFERRRGKAFGVVVVVGIGRGGSGGGDGERQVLGQMEVQQSLLVGRPGRRRYGPRPAGARAGPGCSCSGGGRGHDVLAAVSRQLLEPVSFTLHPRERRGYSKGHDSAWASSRMMNPPRGRWENKIARQQKETEVGKKNTQDGTVEQPRTR